MTTATIYTHNDLANMPRQQVIDILRATDQYRTVSFGKVRKFSACDVRQSSKGWQVRDGETWCTSYWCQP